MAFDAETRAALIEQVRRFVTETCVPVEAQVGPHGIEDHRRRFGHLRSARLRRRT